MRKLQKYISAVLLCAVLVCTVSISVFADSSNVRPMPVYREQEWYSPSAITGTEKGKEVFTFTAVVNGEPMAFRISAPSEGGMRFYTDTDGVFEPESLNELSYSDDPAGYLNISAPDGTRMIVKERENGWELVLLRDSEELLTLSSSDIEIGYRNGINEHIRISAPLSDGEKMYGTGERFNSVNQVGTKLQLWNLDAAYHASDKNLETKVESYINVPFMHSSRGYSFFLNSAYCVDADFGVTDSSRYTLESYGPKFDFYYWTGTPTENVQSYTALTGRSFLPPKWAFSYWAGAAGVVWRASDDGKGEYISVLQNFINGYKKLGIDSLAAIYTESPIMFDSVAYSILKKNNIRMLMWTSGYFDYSEILDTLKITDDEAPVVRSSINNWLYNVKSNDTAFLDHTHPNAKVFMERYLKQYVEWGARGMMVDMGEKITEDSLYYNGMSGAEMHNFSSYYYLKTVNEAMTSLLDGEKDFILFQRSGSAGSQAFGANFTGDNRGDMSGLKQQLNAGLSLSSSGFSVWGGDIGGFNATDSADTYMRWLEFSVFEPLMREHGVATCNPWEFGPEAEEVFKKMYWLRENLIDTIYSAAVNSNRYGTPMAQPLIMAFPEQENLFAIEDEYMFCDNLLVCPVTENSVSSREVTLPSGNWYSLWDGECTEGGVTLTAEAPQSSIPVYLKAGAIMPVTVADTYRLSDSLSDNDSVSALIVTPPDSDTSFEAWDDTGEKSVVYKNLKTSEKSFTVKCASGSETQAIMAYGIIAEKVKADGIYLPKLKSAGKKPGYYIDGTGRTVIILPSGRWNNIEISGESSSGASLNVAEKAIFTDSKNNKETKLLASLKNNDSEYQWSASPLKGTYLMAELDKEYTIDSVALKWGHGYASAYKIEVSFDGKNWSTVLGQTEGDGGTDLLNFEPVRAKFVRFSEFERGGNVPASLYNVSIYEENKTGTSLMSTNAGYFVSSAAALLTASNIPLFAVCSAVAAASLVLICITAVRCIKRRGGKARKNESI